MESNDYNSDNEYNIDMNNNIDCKTKYLIYKATGGLVHMLNGIEAAAQIAKNENRVLIIDTKILKAFNKLKNFCDYFFIYDRNLIYYTDYSTLDPSIKYKNLSLDQIIEKKSEFNNEEKKYYLEDTNIRIHKNLDGNKDDKIKFYSGCSDKFIKNLRLNNNILYEVFDNTYEIIKKYKKYISVHFRNTDMSNDIHLFVKKINNTSKLHSINNIFIATDDYKAFDIFKSKLPHLHLFRLSEPENLLGKNIHYHSSDKHKQIMNILIDIYMIIKSSYFIPSFNSGISKWIIYQKNNHYDYAIFDDEYNFKIIY